MLTSLILARLQAWTYRRSETAMNGVTHMRDENEGESGNYCATDSVMRYFLREMAPVPDMVHQFLSSIQSASFSRDSLHSRSYVGLSTINAIALLVFMARSPISGHLDLNTLKTVRKRILHRTKTSPR